MNRESTSGSIPIWKWISAVGMMALIIAGAGYGYYRHEVNAIRQVKYDNLKAIGDLKAGDITKWRDEHLHDGRINSIGRIRTDALAWLSDPGKNTGRETLLSDLQYFQDEEEYQNMIIAGTDGNVLISRDPAFDTLEPEARSLVTEALSAREAVVGDFFRSVNDRKIYLDTAAPILGADGNPVAVLLLRSDPQPYLYPLIESWPIPSDSAETLLVRRDGDHVLFLNSPRFQPQAALTQQFPLTDTNLPAVQAVTGMTGMFDGIDYQGSEVLADIRPVPDTPWFLVAKVNTDEILAEARFQGYIILLLVGLFIIITILMSAFMASARRRNIYQSLFQSERKRRQAMEEFRATLRGIGDGVIATDAAGRVRQMNPVAEALTGWKESEAVGHPLEEVFVIINEDTLAAVSNPAMQVLMDGRVVGLANHTLLVARDGTRRPITDSGAPIRDESGAITGVALVFRDRTKERAAEKTLVESEVLLKQSQRIARVGHYSLDITTGMWSSSEMLDEIFGIGSDYMRDVGGWLNLVHPEQSEEMNEYFSKHVLEGGNLFNKEYRIIRVNDQSERWLHGLGELERDSDGRTVKMFGTIQDITDHRLADEERESLRSQLQQAQKMESVGRLAGGVAHDFNNMLGVILGYAQMAMEVTPAEAPIRENLQEIVNAAQHSADLTRQLLAFARRQNIDPKVLDLNETVASLLTMIQRLIGEDIRLVWQPGASLSPVRMDPAQVDQMLVNMAVNSRDAIDGVGIITVETQNATFDEAYCLDHTGFSPGDYVMLAFSDDGRGIPREVLEQVFEPFFTTKEVGKGTGLGLATVYGIVKQNEGFINVYSEPGQGTTFRIYLPAVHGEEIAPGANAEPTAVGGSETVLVVEDELEILNISRRTLELCGYKVLSADSPVVALKLAAEYPGTIHLLVTDVIMPEMNGKDMRDRLVVLRPGIRVLFMSGYTADVIAERGVLEPGVMFLQKPFSVNALAAKVRAVLDS
ncbi:MAG: PAS domain S-box protein [Thermoleophilia bacterium]